MTTRREVFTYGRYINFIIDYVLLHPVRHHPFQSLNLILCYFKFRVKVLPEEIGP